MVGPEDVPEPSAELILWAAFTEATLSMLSAKDRLRFLRKLDALFEEKADLAEVTRIRPRSKDPELRKAIKGARAWYRACLPVFLEAELNPPPEGPARSVKKLLGPR